MAGAVQTKAYKRLLKSLVKARMDASQSQADLAKRLGKPPSFIGKYELGERRIDVVETINDQSRDHHRDGDELLCRDPDRTVCAPARV